MRLSDKGGMSLNQKEKVELTQDNEVIQLEIDDKLEPLAGKESPLLIDSDKKKGVEM